MSFRAAFKNVFSGDAQGSVFTKIAEHDSLAKEANGRIIAIDAANTANHAIADFITSEVDRVHREADAVKARITSLLSLL